MRYKIDVEIANLISNMWNLGIETNSSCQARCSFACPHKWKKKIVDGESISYHDKTDNCYNNVWISFRGSKDYEKFINYVAEYSKDDDSMYSHILGYFPNQYPNDTWHLRSIHDNLGVEGHFSRPKLPNGKRSSQELWIEDRCNKNDIRLMPQITFPRTHLKYVEDRLIKAVKNAL